MPKTPRPARQKKFALRKPDRQAIARFQAQVRICEQKKSELNRTIAAQNLAIGRTKFSLRQNLKSSVFTRTEEVPWANVEKAYPSWRTKIPHVESELFRELVRLENLKSQTAAELKELKARMLDFEARINAVKEGKDRYLL